MGKDYTTDEAARKLGITTRRVRQLAREYGLERRGRDYHIPASLVERLKRRKTAPGPPAPKPKKKSPG